MDGWRTRANFADRARRAITTRDVGPPHLLETRGLPIMHGPADPNLCTIPRSSVTTMTISGDDLEYIILPISPGPRGKAIIV